MLGILIDGFSSTLEVNTNALIALKNKRHHDDPATALNLSVARLKSIDALRAQREAAIAQLPDSQEKAICAAESQVLKTFRDWLLYEFCDVYCDVRSYQSSGNIYYAFNIASNACYLASYLTGMDALKHPEVGGKSSIQGLVGDSLGVVAVPASNLGYNVIYKFWNRMLTKKFKEKLDDPEVECKKSMDALAREVSRASEPAIKANDGIKQREELYSQWAIRYDRFIDKQLENLRHTNKVALQGNISGPAISGSYLAQDVMGVTAFYSVKNEKGATSLSFAGNTTALVGSASSLALTNWLFISEHLYARRLKKKHLLPSELLKERLDTLDDLDAILAHQ
jgi:hypothetical protein